MKKRKTRLLIESKKEEERHEGGMEGCRKVGRKTDKGRSGMRDAYFATLSPSSGMKR